VPRTGKVEKRQIEPDPIYKNLQVAKLINKLMKSGKKTVAEKIVYEAFKHIKEKKQDPVESFEKAIENIVPKMEVRPRRVGGASYMVPMEVRGQRRQSLAISWLVTAARQRDIKEVENRQKNQPLMVAKLTLEIMDASAGTGKAVAKKEDMHRMAEANKAFAHFRW